MSDFTLLGCSIINTLLAIDNNIKKPILIPETPITLTTLSLTVKNKPYSCDSKTMLQ